VTDESAELLHELRVLCARLPVPQPTWHPYVPMILSCREDFEYALALAAEHPKVILRAAALAEETSKPTLDPGASPELAAAYERLHALPDPDGQHPFLDEIVPALEAMRVLLVALSQVAAA
jgi:hypothetical protein